MSTILLPERPTGVEIVQAVKAHANDTGIALERLLKTISSKSPSSWLKEVGCAARPRPVTVARVRALLADQDLPPKQRYRPQSQSGTRGDSVPPVTLVRVERDPCWRCGVRGDLGCAHRPPFVEEDLLVG